MYIKLYFPFLLDIKMKFEIPQGTPNRLNENNLSWSKENISIKIHLGDHWSEDDRLTRRPLFGGYYPHIHYEMEIPNIFIDKGLYVYKFKVSTMLAGMSIGILELKLDQKHQGNIRSILKFQDPNDTLSYKINKFFIREILHYTKVLYEWAVNNDILKNYILFPNESKGNTYKMWSQEFGKEEADYIFGLMNQNGQKIYFSMRKYLEKYNKNYLSKNLDELPDIFYQFPYIVVIIKNHDANLKQIYEDLWGWSEIPPFKTGYSKVNLLEQFQKAQGVIYFTLNNKGENILHMIADTTKCVVNINIQKWDDKLIDETGFPKFLHRALFVILTRSHFSILWDSILNYLFSKSEKILNKCEFLRKVSEININDIKKITKDINNLALEVSQVSSKLYVSYIWRYSTFLTAELGILHTIYHQLDSIFTTSHKMEEIRKEFEELRRQVEFASFFVKEKMAEAMYRPLLEESKEGSDE